VTSPMVVGQTMEAIAKRRVALYVPAFALAALAVVIARRPETVFRPQFFNEDGQVFYIATFFDDPWSVTTRPYAGYLHLAPRLGAWATRLVSVPDAPLLANLLALALSVVVGAYVASGRTAGWLPNRWARTAGALFVVLVPGSAETLGSLTYIQWYLAVWLAVWLVSSRPAGPWALALDSIMVTVAALSGPFVVLLAPCLIAKLVGCHGKDRLAPFLGLVGAGVQIGVLITADRHGLAGMPGPGDVLQVVAYRGLLASAAGPTIATIASRMDLGIAFGVGAAFSLAVLLAVAVWGIPRGVLLPLVWSAGASLAGAIAAQTAGPSAIMTDAFGGQRYFLVPATIYGLAVISGVAVRSRRARMTARVLVAILVVGVVVDFRLAPQPDLKWPTSSPCIGGTVPCVVPVHYADAWSIYWPGRAGPYVQPPPTGTGTIPQSP